MSGTLPPNEILGDSRWQALHCWLVVGLLQRRDDPCLASRWRRPNQPSALNQIGESACEPTVVECRRSCGSDLRSMNVFLDADEWLTKLPRIL